MERGIGSLPEDVRKELEIAGWREQFRNYPNFERIAREMTEIDTRFYQAQERYDAVRIAGYPTAVQLPVGIYGAMPRVFSCSSVIVWGETGSTHWIFEHLTYGSGDDTRDIFHNAGVNLHGELSMVIFGAQEGQWTTPSGRADQVRDLRDRIENAGLPLPLQNIKTFWNDVATIDSYHNVIATVLPSGEPRGLVELVHW